MVVTNFGAAGFSDFRLSEKTTVYYHFGGLPEATEKGAEAAGDNSKEWAPSPPREEIMCIFLPETLRFNFVYTQKPPPTPTHESFLLRT